MPVGASVMTLEIMWCRSVEKSPIISGYKTIEEGKGVPHPPPMSVDSVAFNLEGDIAAGRVVEQLVEIRAQGPDPPRRILRRPLRLDHCERAALHERRAREAERVVEAGGNLQRQGKTVTTRGDQGRQGKETNRRGHRLSRL